jgi:glycosyltransferase involved in cell wall biosynthesis
MLKIAFYMTTVLEHSGGMEKYLIETAAWLSKYPGIKADVVTMDNITTERIVNLLHFYYFKKFTKASIYQVQLDAIKKQLGNAAYYKCRSFSELSRKLLEYDIIYSKNELLEGYVFKFLVGYQNVPSVIFGCHTPIHYPAPRSLQAKLHNFLYNGSIYKYLSSGVKLFHVINSADEPLVKNLFFGIPVRKIYNPFNFKNFQNNSVHYLMPEKPDKKTLNIAWVGRLTEQKGIDNLIRIIDNINGSDQSLLVNWYIVGDGEDKPKILNLSQKWTNVHYLGRMDNHYLASLYLSTGLFISTSKWEGFPYSVLEAQSMGLPVIAFNINGCNDIIIDGVTGILVNTVDQFTSALKNYIAGKYKFSDIEKYIQKKFDAAVLYKQLVDMFYYAKNL